MFLPGRVDGLQEHRQPDENKNKKCEEKWSTCLSLHTGKILMLLISMCSTDCCPQGGAVQLPPAAEHWEKIAAASSPSPAPCQRWLCRSHTWCLQLPAGSSSSWLGGIPAACEHTEEVRWLICIFKKPHAKTHQKWNLLVIFFQSLHQVPTTLDVPPLDVGVKTGAQGELECLAGDRLGGAIHDEITSRETLVEVTLLQVQPEGKCRPQLHYILNSGTTEI